MRSARAPLFFFAVFCVLAVGLESLGDDPPTCDQKCRLRYIVYTDTPGAFYQYEEKTCEFCVVNGTIQGTCEVKDETPDGTANTCVIPTGGALATTRTKINAQNVCAIAPKAPGVERRTEAKNPTPISGEMPVAADKTECSGGGISVPTP